MPWYKFLFGGLIGFAIFGPIGSALLIGAIYYFQKNKGKSQITSDLNDDINIFLHYYFSILAKVAKSDGRVSKEEIDFLTDHMIELSLSKNNIAIAKKSFKESLENTLSVYDYAKKFAEYSDIDGREIIYLAIWEVVLSDGVIHENELTILKNIPSHLKISAGSFERLSAEFIGNQSGSYDDTLELSYGILGCSKDDSDKEIKLKFRRAMASYHTDKLESKELPEAIMIYAKQHTQKLTEAYDIIKKSRGF